MKYTLLIIILLVPNFIFSWECFSQKRAVIEKIKIIGYKTIAFEFNSLKNDRYKQVKRPITSTYCPLGIVQINEGINLKEQIFLENRRNYYKPRKYFPNK
jgi:hypothetical protein